MSSEKFCDKPFFFVQMTDPQLGMATYNQDFVKETKLWQKAAEIINQLRPAFVVLTGDLVNVPEHQAQTNEALRLLDLFSRDIKYYILPGNHDVGDEPTEHELTWFRKTFGPDRQTWTHQGAFFLTLNSNIIHKGQNLPHEALSQWQWLEHELTRANRDGYAHPIILLHHPLFLENADEPEQYFNIPPRERAALLDIFRAYGVRYVFAGHLHENRLARTDTLEMVTTGPVGLPLGDAPSGMRLIKVFPDHVEHKYYGLDDFPTTVELI